MLAHPLVEENPDLTELTEQSRARQLAGEGVAEVAYPIVLPRRRQPQSAL